MTTTNQTADPKTPLPAGLAGLLWTWWYGDVLPSLPELQGLRVSTVEDLDLLSCLCRLEIPEIEERLRTAHQPYVAWIGTVPVAYGWSASGLTHFGSPPVSFIVPLGNRYLMDFATLPAWHGRGIYPRLLQAILDQECSDAERFWILHHRDNVASARGIQKAGFAHVAEIHFLETGGLGIVPLENSDRALAGAHLLGLPVVG